MDTTELCDTLRIEDESEGERIYVAGCNGRRYHRERGTDYTHCVWCGGTIHVVDKLDFDWEDS